MFFQLIQINFDINMFDIAVDLWIPNLWKVWYQTLCLKCPIQIFLNWEESCLYTNVLLILCKSCTSFRKREMENICFPHSHNTLRDLTNILHKQKHFKILKKTTELIWKIKLNHEKPLNVSGLINGQT